jgi:hypothetical protein
VARESWFGNECRAQGFDVDRDRGQFPAFLLRTNLSPEEFTGELLRPSDVRSLFPGLDHIPEKTAALREAFHRWQHQKDRP